MKGIEFIGAVLKDYGAFNGVIDKSVLDLPEWTDPDTVLRRAFGESMDKKGIMLYLRNNRDVKHKIEIIGEPMEQMLATVERLCDAPLCDFSEYTMKKNG